MLREHFAEYVAYALWAGFALCVFVFRRHVAPQDCSFIGAATLAASGLAIARRYRGPRLQPGQRIVTDENYELLDERARLGYARARDERETGPELRVI